MGCIICGKHERIQYYAFKNEMKVSYCAAHFRDCADCDSFTCELRNSRQLLKAA